MSEQQDNLSLKEKYVTFMSGKEYFGLKIEYVNEIIVLQDITAIPESEDYIKGLINLRGKIIPVIDVRLRFKQEPIEYNDRTCIIVINVQSTVVGLIVEKIAEVVEIPEENLLPSPSIGHNEKKKTKERYVYAIGKVGDTVKLLLDPDKLISDEDLSMMEQASEEAQELQEIEE
nr:purine-binding chemotaxis protein CheW [Eubacterium sp.]